MLDRLDKSAEVAQAGANIAKNARKQIEKDTGRPAVRKLNAKNLATAFERITSTCFASLLKSGGVASVAEYRNEGNNKKPRITPGLGLNILFDI